MIELSAAEAFFISSGLTLVGALIGALATIFSARHSVERQRLYEESATFRAEFVDEIQKLRTAGEDAFTIIDARAMNRHRRAKILFEPWVSRENFLSFQDIWEAYEKGIKTKAPGSIDNRKAECELALSQIESLLSFATYKG